MLWYAPVSPADGATVAKLTQIASDALIGFGFEPMISLTVLTPRTVLCVISITYDREVAGQDEQAKTCYDQLVSRCNREGFFPYRLGIQSMARANDGPYPELIGRLKDLFDPNGVLAPGRYDERITLKA